MNALESWLSIFSAIPNVLDYVCSTPAVWIAGACAAVVWAVKIFCSLGVNV